MSIKSTNDIDKTIGSRILHCRKVAKMSQAELAEKLGISRQQVCFYEKASCRVSGSRLSEIANIFNKPFNFFFDQ
jgi:transcriptional regulator with XRE-family HTH domain